MLVSEMPDNVGCGELVSDKKMIYFLCGEQGMRYNYRMLPCMATAMVLSTSLLNDG